MYLQQYGVQCTCIGSSIETQAHVCLPVFLQAEGDYYTRDEIVADYPHLRQL